MFENCQILDFKDYVPDFLYTKCDISVQDMNMSIKLFFFVDWMKNSSGF